MPDDDPFDDFFDEIERMMNQMFGGNAQFHFEHRRSSDQMERDIHVDIHETAEEVRIVADMPGVEKDDIELTCDGETLSLAAAADDRTYSERISLPVPVDEHSASATYNNGVLEVIFERTGESSSTSIDI